MTHEREYLRVTPSGGSFTPQQAPDTITSLHKLGADDSTSILTALIPFASQHGTPPTFEFVALSAGADEPVEFYYGIDQPEHLDTLEQRLTAIYPTTFDIERVERDLVARLHRPVEYDRNEFIDRLEQGHLYYEPDADAVKAGGEIETNGQDVDTGSEQESERSPTATDGGAAAADPSRIDYDGGSLNLAAPSTLAATDALTELDGPTATDDEAVLARPPLSEIAPRAVRWEASGQRKRDWMTPLQQLGQDAARIGAGDDGQNDLPLSALIDHLAEADQPLAFQVVFERKPDWTADALDRKVRLEENADTRFGRIYRELFPMGGPLGRVDDEPSDANQRRVDLLEEEPTRRTFTANMRAVTVPPDDRASAACESTLDALCSAFDSVDGPFYEVDGRRLTASGVRPSTRKQPHRAFTRFRTRKLITGRGSTRPEFVLSGAELANFVLVPSAASLSIEGAKGTRAEQESRNPLPPPHADLMDQLRGPGMAAGRALDETGEPEDQPVRIPPKVLTHHYLRAGTTGAGKTKAGISDILSLYESTEGPIINIDPKGDGMSENYMRAHAERFGVDDLEANVIHIPIPEILPGFSFFDIGPTLEHTDTSRIDAIQAKADHYEEILKLVMGEERYEEAKTAPNIIKALIKTLYDEDYGLQNGYNRTDVDVFGHDQLEHVVDEFWAAGASDGEEGSVPLSSTGRVNRLLNQQLRANTRTFTNIMGGVTNRLEYITEDARLRRIFDNTENQFDFRDLLDENTVILFDLGDLRSDAATVMTGVILTSLHEVLKERKKELKEKPDDYVVNLQIDEAASVTVSGIMNTLLEKGRSFRLSVGLLMQFPKQIEEEGGRKVYLNTLNDIGTLIIGKIAIDRDIARVMANDETSPEEFENRISALPPGEWVIQTQSPAFGETGPTPFSLKPLPLPPGHPESDQPLSEDEEAAFEDALETVHEKTRDQFGVPETDPDTSGSQPATQREQPGSGGDDMEALDQHLAAAVRTVQLQEDGREDNDWVGVPAVTNLLVERLKETDLVCPHDALGDLREHSPLVAVEYDATTVESVIRLTEEGEAAAQPDTGDTQSAGGTVHDETLLAIEAALSSLGFAVEILEQDGSEKPDALASHPGLDVEIAVEAETTTPTKPPKILANLKRAHEAGQIPLFVVQPGDTDDETADESEPGPDPYWAARVARILQSPVNEQQNGETRLYTCDETITFSGGAFTTDGVTAVRAASGEDDSRRSVWRREDDELVLADGRGTEHARVSGDVEGVSKQEFPAIYSYDYDTDEYVVYDHGETTSYEAEAAFEAKWVPIRRPFVPEHELPVPDYGSASYAIVILPDSEDAEPVVYRDETTAPLQTLLDDPPVPATEAIDTESAEVNDEIAESVNENEATTNETETADSTNGTVSSADDAATAASTDDASTASGGDDDGNGHEEAASGSDDPDIGVAAFAGAALTEVKGNVIPVSEVYASYVEFTQIHQFSLRNRSQFTRTLKKHIDVESDQQRVNGTPTRVYLDIDLTGRGPLSDEDGDTDCEEPADQNRTADDTQDNDE